MSANRYLGVTDALTTPIESPGKYSSQWAIPRVETQEQPKSNKKRKQFNNLAVLFVIQVFKQAKKNLFSNRPKRK